MQDTVLNVADLLGLLNQTLEYAYPSVIIEGEVASFKVSKGKYVFFDLKDSEAMVNCFMMAYQLRMPLEDGMKVQVIAQPRITAWGKFSLTIREIRPVGEGSLKRSFELLKQKLQQEGLFDDHRKRRLPEIPERVGVVASIESAGYADFIKIIGERWGGLQLEVADVQVQGLQAPKQLIAALQHFNEQAEPVEVVVIIRGGGSAEDLAVFNDEPLVRAVAASRIPTLVGVGHETDVSLCDFVADIRAATPSNAAQILVPDRLALLQTLEVKKHQLTLRLDKRLHLLRQQVDATTDKLLHKVQQQIVQQQRRVHYAKQVLRQLNPKTVLQRGYSLVRHEQKVITDASSVKVGDELQIELSRAILQVGVQDVHKK
jgi:exodeoxyribonuclease VII large subunit